MALSPAERQARYRDRQKARKHEGLVVGIERARQSLIDEWISQTDADDVDDDELAMLRAFKAEPALCGDDFDTWLTGLLWADLSDAIGRYRKEWRRAQRRPRRQRKELPPY